MRKRLIKTITAAVILTAAGILYYIFVSLTGLALPCLFRKVTGLYCPGCGVTRMLSSLLRLEFTTAFAANPALLISMPFILYLLGRLVYGYVRRGSLMQNKFDKVLTVVLIAVLIVFCIIRNILHM